MPLWRRSEARDAAWALAFALWCVAWPAGIVLAGGATPGFLSLRGEDGLREMVTAFVPLSYGMALFAWGVATFAAMWMLLRLRRWLDPEGRALGAIRWALSSRSLNLAVVMLALSIVVLIRLGDAGVLVSWLMSIDIVLGRFLVAWWWMILLIAIAILSPLAMLCLLNPTTLARDRYERWWRPFWPGIAALLIALLCWQIVPMLTEFAWRFLPDRFALWIPVQALDYLIVLACDLLAFSWWFSQRGASNALALVARLFRWPILRLCLGFDLLWGLWVLAAAVPIVLMALFAVFVGPEYEDWQSFGLPPMPAAYAWLMALAREFGDKEWLFLAIPLAGMLLKIALWRLLYLSLTPDGTAVGAGHAVDGVGR